MGKPSHKGFSKEVKIYSIHSEPEKLRQRTEVLVEASKENNKGDMTLMLVEELKPKIEQIIKKVFYKFCKGHKVEGGQADQEWKNFQKILRRHL